MGSLSNGELCDGGLNEWQFKKGHCTSSVVRKYNLRNASSVCYFPPGRRPNTPRIDKKAVDDEKNMDILVVHGVIQNQKEEIVKNGSNEKVEECDDIGRGPNTPRIDKNQVDDEKNIDVLVVDGVIPNKNEEIVKCGSNEKVEECDDLGRKSLKGHYTSPITRKYNLRNTSYVCYFPPRRRSNTPEIEIIEVNDENNMDVLVMDGVIPDKKEEIVKYVGAKIEGCEDLGGVSLIGHCSSSNTHKYNLRKASSICYFPPGRTPNAPRIEKIKVDDEKKVDNFVLDGVIRDKDDEINNYFSSAKINAYDDLEGRFSRKRPIYSLHDKSKRVKAQERICVDDISNGKELFRIRAVNTIDDEIPPAFIYTTNMIYPSWYSPTPPKGCNCSNGCPNSKRCICIAKNGEEIPYNEKGAIVFAKTLVHECGPSCRCPPSCNNRVTQNGMKIQLEIFKTESRGWGVRSLSKIPSGSFICEYIGELIDDKEAQERDYDVYLFDIGKNLSQTSIYEDDDDSGFTIDGAKYGNVARFINHSCTPNLYPQDVMYDHDDTSMPHVMLFAVEDILPLQELTYDYNYKMEVRDKNGNVRTQSCYCGSKECTGRMY